MIAPTQARYAKISSGGSGSKQALFGKLLNRVHELKAEGGFDPGGQLARDTKACLRDYLKTEARTSDSPDWYSNTVQGNYYHAFGEFESALRAEKRAWKAAMRPPIDLDVAEALNRRSINASNIALHLMALEDFDEALLWAKAACALTPDRPVRYVTLARALFGVGDQQAANATLEELRSIARFDDPTDALAACLTYERPLRELAVDLPAARAIVEELLASKRIQH